MGTRVEWGQVPWWRERKDVEADLILHKAVSWQEAVSPENRISGGILIPNQVNPKPQRPEGIPSRGSSWYRVQCLQRAQGMYRGCSLDYGIARSHALLRLGHHWCGVRTIKGFYITLGRRGILIACL